MIATYRKYLEPSYGEPSPEVVISEPQIMDLENPAVWRARTHLETIAELTSLIKPCCCYKPIMTVRTTNTTLQRAGAEIPLRVYHPEGDGPFPLLVFYHGGGWSMNNLDVYDYVPRYLAKFGGMVVVAVDYRLAPEHRFPTGVEDAYAALEWAVKNASELRCSPSSVTVCGDSSGGNFATVVALMARDRGGPTLHKQVLIYPVTMLKPAERTRSEQKYGGGNYFLRMNSAKGMYLHYVNSASDLEHPYASPFLAQSLQGLPPACILAAECDPLLDQGLMYAARLQDEGVAVEYHLFNGMIHAFLNRTYQKTFEALNCIIAAVPPISK